MLCYDQRLELLPSERKPNSLLQRVSFCERLDQFILQRDADRFLRISVDSGDEGNRCLIVLRRQPLLTDEKVFAVWLQSWATEPGQQAIRDLKSLSSSNTCSFEHQYTRATELGGLPASPLNQSTLMEIPYLGMEMLPLLLPIHLLLAVYTWQTLRIPTLCIYVRLSGRAVCW